MFRLDQNTYHSLFSQLPFWFQWTWGYFSHHWRSDDGRGSEEKNILHFFSSLPIPSKFGKQEVDIFSKLSDDLVLRHLIVPYMKIFSRSRNFNSKWRTMPKLKDLQRSWRYFLRWKTISKVVQLRLANPRHILVKANTHWTWEHEENIKINSLGFFDRQGCNLLHFKSHREPSPVRVRVVQSSHMVHAPFKTQTVQNGPQESKWIKQSCHGFHLLSRSSCLLRKEEKR